MTCHPADQPANYLAEQLAIEPAGWQSGQLSSYLASQLAPQSIQCYVRGRLPQLPIQCHVEGFWWSTKLRRGSWDWPRVWAGHLVLKSILFFTLRDQGTFKRPRDHNHLCFLFSICLIYKQKFDYKPVFPASDASTTLKFRLTTSTSKSSQGFIHTSF